MTRGSRGRANLEEELARLLDDAPAEATSAAGAELSELRELAGALARVAPARPDPDFRLALRAQLVEAASAAVPAPTPFATRVRERFATWRRSASFIVASALSASSIGTAGVAVAAEHAQPGDLLYGVKRATESLRIALADGKAETGRLRLDLAGRRLAEVEAGARELAPDTLIDTLAAMDDHATRGANDLLDAYDSTGDVGTMRTLGTFVADTSARLSAVIDELPIEVVPFANRSLELVRRIEVEAAGLVLHGCAPCIDGPFDIAPPGEGPAVTTRRCCTDEGVTGTGSGDGGTVPSSPDGSGTTPEDGSGDGSGDAPTGVTPTDGLSEVVSDPLGDTTGTLEDTVEGTTGTVDGPVEDTTGTVGDTVDTADDLIVPPSLPEPTLGE